MRERVAAVVPVGRVVLLFRGGDVVGDRRVAGEGSRVGRAGDGGVLGGGGGVGRAVAGAEGGGFEGGGHGVVAWDGWRAMRRRGEVGQK